MKVYISGPITGRTLEEAELHFRQAHMELGRKNEVMTVINPMALNHDHDKTWESYMRHDIKAMLNCNAIYMLNGWEKSKGAIIEFNLAKELKFTILFESFPFVLK